MADLIKGFETISYTDKTKFVVTYHKGIVEVGVGIGVDRDGYSSFWKELMDSHFLGDRERVPLVVHNLFLTEWKVIGKILVKGFIDTQFLPLKLSKLS